MKKVIAAVRRAVVFVGRQVRRILPSFLIGREKAVAAFAAPLIVAQLARLLPSVDIDPSFLEQLILAAITAFTVHTATNTPTEG